MSRPPGTKRRIAIEPSSCRVRVRAGGETVAETRRAQLLYETGLPVRYYIPPEDVRMEHLVPSHRTASYWSLKSGDRIIADAVWAYRDPLPECAAIKGHFCFYPEKAAIAVEDA
jgi:uncharacterized protein (DUF427 family)